MISGATKISLDKLNRKKDVTFNTYDSAFPSLMTAYFIHQHTSIQRKVLHSKQEVRKKKKSSCTVCNHTTEKLHQFRTLV
uniref:Uncharacterized protein n=1 Tax=Arundo donax TaxID=35708 RepID=A0A0A9BYN7_ARUDO